jgi:hypothetical protein
LAVVQPEESDAVIASRSAAWREAFIAATLRTLAAEREIGLMGPFWWDHWRWVRRQQRMGWLPVDETSEDYLVVMVRGLLFSEAIEQAIRDDPGLVDGPIWSLFKPAPSVQKALLGSERYWNPANTWRVALVRLALAGVLDSARLTEAAMEAAEDEQIGRGHRPWYRGIQLLLAHPERLPSPPTHGAPPPGNRLYPRLSR